jgi:hypothetical protein
LPPDHRLNCRGGAPVPELSRSSGTLASCRSGATSSHSRA